MMDLDNLKYTNDTFGHDWGDEYIRQAGCTPIAQTEKYVVYRFEG